MAEYNPRKDRHKPSLTGSTAPLDALLGPETNNTHQQAVTSSEQTLTNPPLDASALDDRWPLERPHVTPQPSALPQHIPLVVWICAGIGVVTGLVATVWAWARLRSFLKR